MKFALIIVTRATNCGALYCDVLFRLQLEWLRGAFSRSFVMLANVGRRGSFANRYGGRAHWLEFRTVFETAGLFHGLVTNAGSRCLRIHVVDAL